MRDARGCAGQRVARDVGCAVTRDATGEARVRGGVRVRCVVVRDVRARADGCDGRGRRARVGWMRRALEVLDGVGSRARGTRVRARRRVVFRSRAR